eukprot:3175264-Lingulodinium_polyedra.AAC.1
MGRTRTATVATGGGTPAAKAAPLGPGAKRQRCTNVSDLIEKAVEADTKVEEKKKYDELVGLLKDDPAAVLKCLSLLKGSGARVRDPDVIPKCNRSLYDLSYQKILAALVYISNMDMGELSNLHGSSEESPKLLIYALNTYE